MSPSPGHPMGGNQPGITAAHGVNVVAATDNSGSDTGTITAWPSEHTPVLLTRELVPGTDMSTLNLFGEDRWYLSPAIFEEHGNARSLNFAAIPAPLRLAAKHYIWQLINRDYPVPFLRYGEERVSVQTVLSSWTAFKDFTVWLHRRKITEFAQVDAELLDRYVNDIATQEISMDRRFRLVWEVRRLWSYRSVLPENMRLPEGRPWHDDAPHELFGAKRGYRDNRTPRIAENTMQALLFWSLQFVENFAPDILAAHVESCRLKSRAPEALRARGPVVFRTPRGQVQTRMAAYLQGLKDSGGSLPGKLGTDGVAQVDWRHIGMVLECSLNAHSAGTPAGKMVLASGLPVTDHAYLDTPITAALDGRPWRDSPIIHQEARGLTLHLSTACMIVIAYLSGARPGEVLNLRRGCIEYDASTDMWLMSGVFFKNAVDVNGNKLPGGARRQDPWVVVKPVADAVAVSERLHDHDLLFPARIEALRRDRAALRPGEARMGSLANIDIGQFITWVNDYSATRGRPGIPPDPQGGINNSRFRRTLAWFIRRRPRGLVAGAIQYGHVHTRLIQGYAGDYNSGFPDEYAYEDFLARLEELAADEQALNGGEQVSGPAADEYRRRVPAATRHFAGHVLTSERQARDLVTNRLLQIYHGDGMTCVFNPHEAACQLRGHADDPTVTPDIDDCRPRCRNVARTDRDIVVIRARRDELQHVVDDELAPPIRHQRERSALERLNTILEEHP